MGWNEYLIKCYAYSRMNEAQSLERWQQARLIAFHARMSYQYKAPNSMSEILHLKGDKAVSVGADPEAMEYSREERRKAKAFNENYLKNQL